MMRTKGLKGGEYYYRPIEKYSFERNEWGILKKRVYRNTTTGELDPEKGHPLIFPNVLRLPEGPTQAMHWRVPSDDTRTILIRASLVPDPPGQEREHDEPPTVIRVPRALNERGDHAMDTFSSQDRMAWETQGDIYDRTLENLGAEDKGIAMYRRLLKEQIELVASGQDPMALIRDPAKARVDFDVSTGQGRQEFVNQSY
jgi:5,5'-dehydrodivanillate O-demethylase